MIWENEIKIDLTKEDFEYLNKIHWLGIVS